MTNLDTDTAKILDNLSKVCLTEKTWKKKEINELVEKKLIKFKKSIYELIQNNITRFFSAYLLTKQDYESWKYIFIGRIFEFGENIMQIIRTDEKKIILPNKIHNVFNSENKLLNFLFSPDLLENLKIVSEIGILIHAFFINDQKDDVYSKILLSADLSTKLVKKMTNKIWKNKEVCEVINPLCNLFSEIFNFSLITKLDLEDPNFKNSVIDYTISSFTRMTQIVSITKHFKELLTLVPDYWHEYIVNKIENENINKKDIVLTETAAYSESHRLQEEVLTEVIVHPEPHQTKEEEVLTEVIVHPEPHQTKEEEVLTEVIVHPEPHQTKEEEFYDALEVLEEKKIETQLINKKEIEEEMQR